MADIYEHKFTPRGYELIRSDEAGKPLMVHRTTGEVYEVEHMIVPKGSWACTPEMQARYKQREAEGQKKEKWRKDCLKYYFVLAEDVGLRPATAARLIYLATYMEYGTGRLLVSQRRPMRWGDLPQLLGVSQAEMYRLRREVTDKYILDRDDGLYMVDKYFLRGVLPRSETDRRYQQFYIEAVRELYRKTPNSRHKYLGYVFRMLPYVNMEYNILCHNPDETNLDYVMPLTVSEFCQKIGYASENRGRLLRVYAGITFDVKDHSEHFCAFVTNGLDIDMARIVVNPRVIYKGSQAGKVDILGKFCEMAA